jgi:hypothetical protein
VIKSEMKSVTQTTSATCRTCGETHAGPHPSKFVLEHVEKTGHTVTIDRAKSTVYGPKAVKA